MIVMMMTIMPITVEHSSDEDDNNGSDEDEDTANADERRGIVETDIVIRNGTLTNKTLEHQSKLIDWKLPEY